MPWPFDPSVAPLAPRSSERQTSHPQSRDQNEGIDERAGKAKEQKVKHIGETAEARRHALNGRSGKESENRQNEGRRGDRGSRLPQKEIDLHGAAPDRQKAQDEKIDPCSGRRRGGKPRRAKRLEQHDFQTTIDRDRD